MSKPHLRTILAGCIEITLLREPVFSQLSTISFRPGIPALLHCSIPSTTAELSIRSFKTLEQSSPPQALGVVPSSLQALRPAIAFIAPTQVLMSIG